MKYLQSIGKFFLRLGYLVRAVPWAVVLGLMEILRSERGRRVLAGLSLAGLATLIGLSKPVRTLAPGEVGVRFNQLTGGVTELREGWATVLPGVHELRRYSLRDQIYRATRGARAGGEAP